MAFELNLNQSQYNDLFEINFDLLNGVDPYLTGMACADAAALMLIIGIWMKETMTFAGFFPVRHTLVFLQSNTFSVRFMR